MLCCHGERGQGGRGSMLRFVMSRMIEDLLITCNATCDIVCECLVWKAHNGIPGLHDCFPATMPAFDAQMPDKQAGSTYAMQLASRYNREDKLRPSAFIIIIALL